MTAGMYPALGMLTTALMLAGCGSGIEAASSGWNARDACASLGRGVAATVGGARVSDAQLQAIAAGGDELAVASMCTFTYANGATLMVLTREAPDADATTTAIENARTGGGVPSPAEPVPGLGKAAFWNQTTRQAQLFIDDHRYVAINFFKLPAGDDPKARSLAVAKAFL